MTKFCFLLSLLLVSATAQAETPPPPANWSLVIHGGAGVIERASLSPAREAQFRAGLQAALDAGTKVLAAGGSAMDAVEAAIVVMEDNPDFNAGKGSVFTYDGVNEMDAAFMDGASRMAGAVAGVTATKNPIRLARRVMSGSPHVMLARDGADRFSREQGLAQVDPDYFATPLRWRQLQEFKARQVSAADTHHKFGTVGAAARDAQGNLAAGTSTGGMTGKRWGRIGDAPVIGAGTYADNRACAVSATGSGEYFIRLGVAHEICARIRFTGESPQLAADHVIKELGALGGDGGVIVAGADGTLGWSFNSPGMYRAKADSSGAQAIAIYGDEE
jgi:beta-aspartyl-peptidase (threonine type)